MYIYLQKITWILTTCALYIGMRVVKEELAIGLCKVFMQIEGKNREVQRVPGEKRVLG